MLDFAVYVLFRIFSIACRAIGARTAAGLGCLLGFALGLIDGRRGRILRNMASAVGPARARSLIGRYYEHMGLLAVEYARLAGLRPDRIHEWMAAEDMERLEEAVARAKGAIILTGHIGNWEMTAQAMVVRGLSLHALFRPLRNRHLDRHLFMLRGRHGMLTHEKFDASRAMLRVLRSRQLLDLLLDQDGGRQGVFVPFFGRLASTLTTAARLARRTGAAIVPVTSFRLPCRTRHRLRVGPEIVPADTGDEKRDILLTTRRCNRALEEAILEHPAQWLWAHRRWNTDPGPEDVAAWNKAAGDASAE